MRLPTKQYNVASEISKKAASEISKKAASEISSNAASETSNNTAFEMNKCGFRLAPGPGHGHLRSAVYDM
jgi:hypothetical protein